MRTPFASLSRDARGVTVVEFAILSPVLFMLLMGSADAGHTLYMRAALQGAVQKIARDATLQENSTQAGQDALDARVTAAVKALANNATITFKRRFYRTFSDAAAAREETYYDTNNDHTCDNNERFIDANNNGVWDADGGDGGQGGAKDRAVYTVTISYPRMFPPLRFNASPNTTVKAVTILQNQPYDDQSSYAAATEGQCA